MKIIPLTQGFEAIVDDEDYEELNKHKWCLFKHRNTYYAQRVIHKEDKKQISVKMHREILKTREGMKTDHKDGNGLNNRKYNLREVTNRQNLQNLHITKSSQYAGVSWRKDRHKWRAQIQINRKALGLGLFNTEIEAHNAYLNKLVEINEKLIDVIVPLDVCHPFIVIC